MAGTRIVDRSLLWYSALLTVLLVCSNLALGLYFRRLGLQCFHFPALRPANCSHEFPRSPIRIIDTPGGDLIEKPAAHLTGCSGGGNQSEVTTPGLQALRWDFSKGTAYTNMVYADGQLHIPRQGLYYVYSQVAFYLACEEWGTQGAGVVLVHNIYRWSDTYPEPIALLTATKSACGGRGDWHATISQGGLFYLHPTDRLFVTVSQPASVQRQEQRTFFGAFMV
ncbi:tumor necrosis factor ligand superfamily member 15-like [Mobula hypostoma]|uniref:tumor necrosis factor ligand superfamily member 15-like n=1 Tax=Mobula hypostoma TaxID=723540 RepID=UPI002FC342AE